MRTINLTCDICNKTGTVIDWQDIRLTLHDKIQNNMLTIPSKKYEDICFECFLILRKKIEEVIEERRKKP